MTTEELLDKIMHGEVVTVKGHTLLTGTQWYDRFKKELSLAKGEYDISYNVAEALMIAARKAAGIE